MNITPVSIFSKTNINYSKQPLNKNKMSSMPAISNSIYNTPSQNLAFTAARRAEAKRTSNIYRKIPVDRKKLETINKTLNSYKETLPAANETYDNFADIYESSENKALRAYDESSPKCDTEGNYRYTEGIDITENSCSIEKAFTYNVYDDTLNSYKEGFVNSRKPAPDGLREIKKGVTVEPGADSGEYFENRIYKTSSFKKGSNNLNTTEKKIIFDSKTNAMLEYSENIHGDYNDNGPIHNFAKRTVSFDTKGAPLSYSEGAEHHKRENYDSAKRVITFTKDSEGNIVPKYYYENRRCFNGQNRVSYTYKAERLENGSWIVVR